MHIEPCTRECLSDWVRLRQALWPVVEAERQRSDCEAMLDRTGNACAFIARADGLAIGFAEATLRQDPVNGCDTSPVAFLEGIYVSPEWRRRGVARALCEAVERWAVATGCQEFASDTWLHNVLGQRMHEALGFEETERVVYYRKRLTG